MKSALQNMSQSKLINRVYVYRTVRSGKVKMRYLFRRYFFFISVHFYFFFVSNSLAYATIPKNKENQNLTEMKN